MYLFVLILSCVEKSREYADFEERGSSCQKRFVLEQEHCCWEGQSWNGERCAGEPICPPDYISSGFSCSCTDGKEEVPAGENDVFCCWKEQGYSTYKKACVGEPICPDGMLSVNNDCRFMIESDGYRAILIPSGSFLMGCSSEDNDCYEDENPSHLVTISSDFYLMETEITQFFYQKIMKHNPSIFQGDMLPVGAISWFDAIRFANQLSEIEGLEQCYLINGDKVSWHNKACKGWRLPTEAEWEYAARAPAAATQVARAKYPSYAAREEQESLSEETKSNLVLIGAEYLKYSGSNNLDEVAWHIDYPGAHTRPVAQKKPNSFGLYDMSGNAWEWCWDWYGDYSAQEQLDPTGSTSGDYRVSRGGRWYKNARKMRASARYRYAITEHFDDVGFRLLRIR